MMRARTAGLTRFTVKAAEQSRRFLTRRGWQFDDMATFAEDGGTYTTALLHLDLRERTWVADLPSPAS